MRGGGRRRPGLQSPLPVSRRPRGLPSSPSASPRPRGPRSPSWGKGRGGGIFRPDHNSLPPAGSCRQPPPPRQPHKGSLLVLPAAAGRRLQRRQGRDDHRSAPRRSPARPLPLPAGERGRGPPARSPGTAADSTPWPPPRPAPGSPAAPAPAPGAARPGAAAPRRSRRGSASPARPPRPPSSHPAPSRTHLGHVITQCHVRRGHVPGALARPPPSTYKGPGGEDGGAGAGG